MNVTAFEKLKNIINLYDGSIYYTPITEEIDYANCSLFTNSVSKKIILPSNKEADPFKWAIKSIETFSSENVYILIPGRMFDTTGTRHGRGGGWYDRFLSQIPKSWIRIGITDTKHFSKDILARNSWDEPMDWVIVCENESSVVFETHAR